MERFQNIKGRAFFFLFFLWFIWFLNFSARTIFSPLMPLIEDEFSISHARASSIFIFTSLGYGVSLFFSGMFSGAFGYKRSIITSLIASGIVFSIMPFIGTFHLLSLATFILGLSTGIYLPSIIPMITEYYTEKTWGKAIAIHDSAASLSIFSAPFIAVFLLNFLQWRQIFAVFAVVFFIAVIVFAFLCDEIKVQGKPNRHLGALMRRRTLWLMGIVWSFAAGANLGVYFIIPLYLTKELLLDVSYGNKIFGLSRIGGIFFSVMAGFIVDRFSLKKTLFVLVLVGGIFTSLLALKDPRLIKFLLFMQASVPMGFFPVGLVAISRIFEKEHRGIATGFIVTLGVIFGFGVIPYLLGVSGDLLSFRVGIFFLGIFMALSSGLIFLLKGLK